LGQQKLNTMKTVLTKPWLLSAILVIPWMSYAQANRKTSQNTKTEESKMMTVQKNRETVQRLYDQALNKRNMALLKDIVSDDFVGARGSKGPAAFEEPLVDLIKGFPDLQWNIQELVGDGDKVVVRWKLQGTHTGPYQHYPITGNTTSNDGMAIFLLKDAKIVSAQVQTDRLGFLQELGVLPVDLTSLSNRKSPGDQVSFIDKFLVPELAKREFLERTNASRNFLRKLTGFIKDTAYENTDEQGNLHYLSIAVWESADAVKKAKEAVQAEYKRQGFNPLEMVERLNITMERGIYKEAIVRP
jgi:steroid delta-isomerase-like uncharacterized protein